jgi:conjugal transfer/entry exclusion protein
MSYNTFENDVKLWVQYDTEINTLNEQIKKIKNKKVEINDKIEDYINENNLNSATVKITGGKLQFKETTTYQSYTLNYIRECLNDIITSKEQVDTIINHLKNKRDKKYKFEINRTLDKTKI